MANNSVRGLNALGYVGVNAPNPPNTIVETRAPTVNDYAQFNLLDEWLYYTPSSQTIYILTSKANGVATWANFGSGTGAVTFTADSGMATTSASNINDLGSTNISTSGSGSTVTTSLNPNISVTSVTATGNITSSAGNIAATAGHITAGTFMSTGTSMTVGTNLTVSGLGQGVVQSDSAGLFSSTEGTDGQLLISSSIGAPAWHTITAGSGVTVTNGHNTITLSAGGAVPLTFTANDDSTATPALNDINIIGTTPLATTASGSTVTMAIASTIPVNLGGTGIATATLNGVLYGNDTSPFGITAAGTTGQVLIATTDSAPSWGMSPATFIWNTVVGATNALVNNGYIANGGSTVVITLPTAAVVGSIIEVAGKGVGGWQIAQNASPAQQINFGTSATTSGAGGYLQSTNTYDCVRLLCITANTTFEVLSSQGNITIV